MVEDGIAAMVRMAYQIPEDSRIDVELKENGSFRATEVRSDLSIGKRAVGYLRRAGGIVFSEEPDLTFEQAKVFEDVMQGFAEKLLDAEAGSLQKFPLIKDGDYPNLFYNLDFRPNNIAGNVKEGMLPVWHSLENLLELYGYRAIKLKRGEPGAVWEIWAQVR